MDSFLPQKFSVFRYRLPPCKSFLVRSGNLLLRQNQVALAGFAPMGKSSVVTPSEISSDDSVELRGSPPPMTANKSLITQRSNARHKYVEKQEEEDEEKPELLPRRLVIIVTPANGRDKRQGVLLRRMANALNLVPPPLLWIVVERHSESDELRKILRNTGVMYRHLIYKENFTDQEAEMDHQRNAALRHIHLHRLSGIVHFAELSNCYDLEFFDELRKIKMFGTWPISFLSVNKKRAVIEGPVCNSSRVIGWHLRKKKNQTEPRKPPLHISSFAFSSSILWDPERWGRASLVQDTSQNAVKYVKQVVLEDEAKLKGIPSQDCSKILLWHLQLSTGSGSSLHL